MNTRRLFLPPEVTLPAPEARGELRLATAEMPVVLQWVKAFYRETLHTEFFFDKNTGKTPGENSAAERVSRSHASGIFEENPGCESRSLPHTQIKTSLYIWYDSQPVAMGMLTDICESGECRINLIYVEPAFRGRGYGRAIAAALAAKARERGLLPVLGVAPENMAANALYASLGFIK